MLATDPAHIGLTLAMLFTLFILCLLIAFTILQGIKKTVADLHVITKERNAMIQHIRAHHHRIHEREHNSLSCASCLSVKGGVSHAALRN